MSLSKGAKPKPRNTRRKRKNKKRADLLAGCPSPVVSATFSGSETPCLKDGNKPLEEESKVG